MDRSFSVFYADGIPPIHAVFDGSRRWLVTAFLHTTDWGTFRLRWLDVEYDMCVRLGNLGDPRNNRATDLLRSSIVSSVGGVDPERLTAIHGTAVLIERMGT